MFSLTVPGENAARRGPYTPQTDGRSARLCGENPTLSVACVRDTYTCVKHQQTIILVAVLHDKRERRIIIIKKKKKKKRRRKR